VVRELQRWENRGRNPRETGRDEADLKIGGEICKKERGVDANHRHAAEVAIAGDEGTEEKSPERTVA
jgi:hypothetical protein